MDYQASYNRRKCSRGAFNVMNENNRANSVLITINLGDPYIIESRGVVYDVYFIKNNIPVIIITSFFIKNASECDNSLFTIIISIKRISRIIFTTPLLKSCVEFSICKTSEIILILFFSSKSPQSREKKVYFSSIMVKNFYQPIF